MQISFSLSPGGRGQGEGDVAFKGRVPGLAAPRHTCYMPTMSEKNLHWEAAKKRGTDMSLLKANLEKTPTQRVRDHLSALELARTLRVAGEKHYARIRKTS